MPFTIGPKIHNVIPSPLKNLIHDFFSLTDWKGLYLSGGTCLAEYYFGHRISIDMDIFTPERTLFEQAKRYFQDPRSFPRGAVTEIRVTPHLAQYLYKAKGTTEPVKVDLMLDIAVRLANPLKVGPVTIDSLDDLLANKIGCLVQRSEVKDYLDLYYLIPASHLMAKEIIAIGQKKEGGLDPLILANQMGFLFAKPAPEKSILGKTDWADCQQFFKKFQKECLELIRP